MICRHASEEALCIVEECRAKGLAEVIRRLVNVGSPHEDVACPEDDTCECKLASLVNQVLYAEGEREKYRHQEKYGHRTTGRKDVE